MYRVAISVEREDGKKMKDVYFYSKYHDIVTIEERRYARLVSDEMKDESDIAIHMKDIIEKSE
jgi:hypothetical protein